MLKGGLFDSGTSQGFGLSCPAVAILEAPSELIRFVGPSTGRIQDIRFHAKLEITSVSCEIEPKATFVSTDARLSVVRGPANREKLAKFSFFVAVLDGEKSVILHQSFPIEVEFDSEGTRVDFEDSVTIQIDKKDNVDPATYSIYAGFEMTPEELRFNRRRQR